MSNFIHVHCRLIILDGINYPIVSLANAVSFLRREFLGALGPGIISQGLDTFDDLFGPSAARKAVRLLRSKELAKKLILTKESLNSIENEIYDELLKEEEE